MSYIFTGDDSSEGVGDYYPTDPTRGLENDDPIGTLEGCAIGRHAMDEIKIRGFLAEKCEVCGQVDMVTRPCQDCPVMAGTLTFQERRVVRTFTTNPADPTLAYELECGHSTIDF